MRGRENIVVVSATVVALLLSVMTLISISAWILVALMEMMKDATHR